MNLFLIGGFQKLIHICECRIIIHTLRYLTVGAENIKTVELAGIQIADTGQSIVELGSKILDFLGTEVTFVI